MTEANFPEGKNCVQTDPLRQYDRGAQLIVRGIEGLGNNTQIHFENRLAEIAYVRSGTLTEGGQALTVDIPNAFLESAEIYPKKAWVYQTDGESGETVGTILIPVIGRSRPEDYISQEDLSRDEVILQAVEKYFELHPLRGYEIISNKMNQITNQSHTGDDEKYPTVSAARDFVDFKVGSLEDYVDDEIYDLGIELEGKADSATTLAGYGITDAYTKSETDSILGSIETLLAQI